MGDRCRGGCCRAFYLPVTPEEILGRRFYDGRVRDGRQIAEMVRHLGRFQAGQTPTPMLDAPSRTAGDYYTCINLDEPTGNCRIYDHRPDLCRTYPNGGRCQYEGCGWDAAREGRVDREGRVREPGLVQIEAAERSGRQLMGLPKKTLMERIADRLPWWMWRALRSAAASVWKVRRAVRYLIASPGYLRWRRKIEADRRAWVAERSDAILEAHAREGAR